MPRAKELLAHPYDTLTLTGGPMIPALSPALSMDSPWTRFRFVTDPRKKRGARHPLPAILKIVVSALLCGATNFKAMGDWAEKLSQESLNRLGCRLSEKTNRFQPPTSHTLRRVVLVLEPDSVEKGLTVGPPNRVFPPVL